MTVDLDDLEAKAKAATPGPWYFDDREGEIRREVPREWIPIPGGGKQLTGSGYETVLSGGSVGYENATMNAEPDDCSFIAAANPTTVLALIDDVRRERAAHDEGFAKASTLVDDLRQTIAKLSAVIVTFAMESDFCIACEHHPSTGHALNCPAVP